MTVQNAGVPVESEVRIPLGASAEHAAPANWVENLSLLWQRRRILIRTAAISLALSLAIAFLIPKQYESTARIMPPENSGAGAAMYAALAGKGLDGVGGLIASLLGGRTSGALFVEFLRSGTVSGHLIDKFQLQHVYRKRYRVDTAKYLARHTKIQDDKKSGVITILVSDTDPERARDLAQGYLDELNQLVNRTSTSSAHQERVFIEQRLHAVQGELERAQIALSNFSSTNVTVDLREQTHAMVDAGAKLQGELIATQVELDSLRQIYGDDNVRMRAAKARASDLRRELTKLAGNSAELPSAGLQTPTPDTNSDSSDEVLYPSLRQLPRLAVPYADLYRKVKTQEAVYELLTQEYEIARIQEAKDIPVVNVIDAPGIPEKKSFPPRLLLTLLLSTFAMIATAGILLVNHRWQSISSIDPRKQLFAEVCETMREVLRRYRPVGRGIQ